MDYSMFFLQLSVGILALSPVVPWKAVGKGYYLMNLLIGLGLLPVAWLFRAAQAGEGFPAFGADADGLTNGLVVAYGVLALLAVMVFWVGRGAPAAALTLGASIAGWLAVVVDGVRAAGVLAATADTASPAATPWLLGANYLAGAGVLGTCFGAMLLGHWYLVVKDLPVGPLKRMTLLFFAFVALRGVLVGVAYALDPAGGSDLWLPALITRFLFGLGAPLALSWMIWGTVKIRSTQSATGILYGVCVFILMGEAASRFILIKAGFPL